MNNQKIMPFLTMNGTSEQAMNFYVSVLPGAKITKLVRYGKEHPFATTEEEGKILHGELCFHGHSILFLDMDSGHPAPQMSWATSLYTRCEDEEEFDFIFAGLSPGGVVMMGPEQVGDIRKCAWVSDKYGVTWQLIWE